MLKTKENLTVYVDNRILASKIESYGTNEVAF
jgi:hypothetical protein